MAKQVKLLTSRLAISDHQKLADWILANWPEQIGVGNPLEGESAAEVAIRLMDELRVLKHIPPTHLQGILK